MGARELMDMITSAIQTHERGRSPDRYDIAVAADDDDGEEGEDIYEGYEEAYSEFLGDGGDMGGGASNGTNPPPGIELPRPLQHHI
eukprot:932945-Heterocapsa_arctica.AAC.1